MPDYTDETEVKRKPITKEVSGVLAPGESVVGNNTGLGAFFQRTAPAGKWVTYLLRFEAHVHDTDPRVRTP